MPLLTLPPDLPLRRERLRVFERIAPQPLPKRFYRRTASLPETRFRLAPFFKGIQFGGILADDMGLGKTVQVLAYLLSQQEQAGAVYTVTLLVVPKSLIANWQREITKSSRRVCASWNTWEISATRIPAVFNEYDVVLTTYGTMLRDIEILRGYKFHYVILDKSQAIKNPLAKSAKAARLLNAGHRLVLTGTPVENNTFELWSQFAFLNPGLLGSMETFKHEFANPIESGGDERSAAIPAQTGVPFHHAPHKGTGSPELPPRTERIIYTDMDTAQKKLYGPDP